MDRKLTWLAKANLHEKKSLSASFDRSVPEFPEFVNLRFESQNRETKNEQQPYNDMQSCNDGTRKSKYSISITDYDYQLCECSSNKFSQCQYGKFNFELERIVKFMVFALGNSFFVESLSLVCVVFLSWKQADQKLNKNTISLFSVCVRSQHFGKHIIIMNSLYRFQQLNEC